MHHVKRPPEVRVHRIFVVGELHVIRGTDLNDAGVVDQHVDASVLLERPRDGALGVVAPADVVGIVSTSAKG